jgi:transcriptional regulator with XRE-family HTH domain
MKAEDSKYPINIDFFENLTGDIDTSEVQEVDEIGNRIRKLREGKGLSLDDLSKMTGFEKDLLAGIESKEIQPQIGTVIKLSKALDSAFGRLVSGVGDKLYSITRRGQQKIVSRSTSRKGSQHLYTYKSLAPEVQGRHMEALLVQLKENPEKETSVHDGEEFIYVLDGTIVLEIGDDQFELEAGDSVYYLSTTPHMIAAKKGTATILAVLHEG